MDLAQLILDYVKTLIWPTLLILTFFLFRSSIEKLMLRLQSAKVAGVEANFEVKIEDATHQIEDAKVKLIEPRNPPIKFTEERRPAERPQARGDTTEDPSTTAELSDSSAVVPNVGNVITNSELSRIRHPSHGVFLYAVSETISATGLPRTPRFNRIIKSRDNWQLNVADLWHELERYLDGLSYSIVTVLSREDLSDFARSQLQDGVELYQEGALYPEDLLDRLGRWLSLRSVSAVSIGIAKLREIECDMRSVPLTKGLSDISDRYRAGCEGVVDVLDTIFRRRD